MRKRLKCLLLAALILGGVSTTVLAAAPPEGPGANPSPEVSGSQPPAEAAPDPDETPAPKESGELGETPAPEESGMPEEPPVPEEPEPPTLEELRDTLMAILGDSGETQSIRASVDRMIALGDPGGTLRQWLESTIRKYQLEQELAQLTGTLGALEASSGELEALAQAAAELQSRLERTLPPPKTAFQEIAQHEPNPVEHEAGEILRRLAEHGVTRFRQLFRGNRSRSEIVATFLGVLELCRSRRLLLAGTEAYYEIKRGDWVPDGPFPETD